MSFKFVSLEREFGSGGNTIARQLGKELSIPVYGREIMDMVAERTGMSVAQVEQYEECATNSFLYAILMMTRSQDDDPDSLTAEQKVFYYEQKFIRDLAKKGPAIFVGHCASEALRDPEHVLRVFVFGSESSKHQRILESYHVSERDAENTRKYYDRRRSNYYSAATGKKWRDHANYDVVLNTTNLSVELSVLALKNMLLGIHEA